MTLALSFDLRQRRRLRTTLADGEEVAFLLPDHTIMHHGDRLQSDDGRVLEILALDEPLMEARPVDARSWCRAAYHLGNRHVALQIGDGWLRFPSDPVLGRMLQQLAIPVCVVEAPFDPEPGAYGNSHHHHAGSTQGHRGVIQEFSR